jgi:succinate dehydrogenase / fumarate reductase, cytochrome b subunit
MAERPLSPHITVYRWAYTMTLSILHRISGVALAVSLIGFVLWLVSASLGADAYAAILPLLIGVPCKLVLTLAVAALIYHLCNGLRHLAWDMGWGFERADARRSAALVVLATLIGAAVCCYFIFRPGAGAP